MNMSKGKIITSFDELIGDLLDPGPWYEETYWFVWRGVNGLTKNVAYKIDRTNVLRNTMYSGAVISILSFVLRGIYIVVGGVRQGLMTDFQLWIFPLVTMLLAAFLYATKDT